MLKRQSILARLAGVLSTVLLFAVACNTGPQPPATPTKTPANGLVAAASLTASPPRFVTETPTPSITPTPSDTPIVSPTPEASDTPELAPTWTPPAATQEPRAQSHYWLARPIPEGFTNFVDRNYPYGSTSGGQFRVHHGYEFNNPRGTSIIAPATATVAYAGDDNSVQFGPETFFYGLLVVLQLGANDPGSGQPLFLLFAHMDSIDVQQGQSVAAGDQLGTVGSTGIAQGAHLHLEVRVGDMHNYGATRNADLWLAPFFDFGTLAGRVVDSSGNPVSAVSVTMQDQDGIARYTSTYADNTVNSDDALGENFTRGDLPKGYYRVYLTNPFTGKQVEQLLYVEPHKTTWIEFILDS